jgi:hypothetical protein
MQLWRGNELDPQIRTIATLIDALRQGAAVLDVRGRPRHDAECWLRRGEPSQLEISRPLAMSERTLERRLREDSTTFAAILDKRPRRAFTALPA